MRNSAFMVLDLYKQVLRDKTILVVDDNADMRNLLHTVFRSLGAQVYLAECVDDALVSYQKEKPDLLVSDVCMPRRDGFDLIHAIHDELEAEALAKTPAIAISAADLLEVRSEAIESGFSAHFFKPFNLEELLEAAAELLVATRQPALWMH